MSTVCVHGLGYIGLPTAAMLANFEHAVYGYDRDETVRTRLQEGEVHFDEPGLRAFVTQALESENLQISSAVPEAKYHIICVPTPFDQQTKSPDLSAVEMAGEAVSNQLRPGDTAILESTVPPGTTANVLNPILEKSGLAGGSDFALVHCPETVMPGNIVTELQENNRIIGGLNGVSTESAVRLYDSFVRGEIRTVSNPTTAEFVKIIQNTYRDVNIALANEIAKVAADYGVDSRTAIGLANTHPRVDLHQPGPGVGGHCLPVDPWFLGHESESLEMIPTARAVNDSMIEFVIDMLRRELGDLSDKKIAVLGVAYKGDVSDTRNSPGLALLYRLDANSTGSASRKSEYTDGCPAVAVWDPNVCDVEVPIVDKEAAIVDADALVIMSDHTQFTELDPSRIRELMTGEIVIDTKAILDRERWIESGFRLLRV